jgi:transaldolase
MKFFIDTANIEEIKKGIEMGMVDGVTTNPTLISRENRNPKELLKEICELVDGRPVNGEVVAEHAEDMIKEARQLAKIADNICVKIPMTIEGLKAVQTLSHEGIDTNVTLIFSPSQALMAAKAGASYVSVFVGRIDDISDDGMRIVNQTMAILENYALESELIVASIRHPMHVVEAALLGADIATIPFKVLDKLANHPLTDIGIERFLADWENVKNL